MEDDVVFGEEVVLPQQSMLVYIVRSLGMRYAVGLPLVALLAFVIVAIVIWRGRGPFAVSALFFAIAMPLLLGLFSALDGMMASYVIIANSVHAPRPNEIAEGVSMSLVGPIVAMFLTGPAFLLALVGSLVKSLTPEPAESPK